MACRLLFGDSMALAQKRRRQAALLQKLALFLSALLLAISALTLAIWMGCGKNDEANRLAEPAALISEASEGTAQDQNAYMERLRKSEQIEIAIYDSTNASGAKEHLIFTREQLENYLKVCTSPELAGKPIERLYHYSFAQFRKIVAEVLSDSLMAEKLRAEGIPPEVETKILSEREHALVMSLIWINLKDTQGLTEAEAAERRALNMGDYAQPLSCVVTQLFFRTLKEYEAREGDTLESIAQTISGDAAQAAHIRDAATLRTLWIAPADRPWVPFRPLQPGQRLLVPMPKAEREAVRLKAGQAMQRIQAGASMESVAAATGTNPEDLLPVGPLPGGRRPLDRRIYAALREPSFAAGTTTGVIESGNGFHILHMVARENPSVTPLEMARQKMLDRQQVQTSSKDLDRIINDLMKENLKFHEDALMDDNAPTSSAVCEAYGQPFTVADITRYLKAPKYMPRNAEKRKDLIRDINVIRRAVGLGEALARKQDQTPSFLRRMEAIETNMLSKLWLQRQITARPPQTEEQVRDFFQKNSKDFASQPVYSIREIALKAANRSPEAVAKVEARLKQIKASITDVESFKAQARQNDYRDGVRWNQGDIGEVDGAYRGEQVEAALAKATTGTLLGPFTLTNESVLIWVASVNPRRIPAFEEVKEQVIRRYQEKRVKEIESEIRAELLKAVDFKMAVTRK
ncbi:MAG: peptidyl-prolyl cis-trans isomerase [Candidatus Sumerlaeota bacterium]|nr:peptidyl-prolyl cis-trans isomerase [Candidatus Sumerlaeota bacterium]